MCKLLIIIKIICYTGNIIPDFFFFILCFQHRNIFAWNKLHCLIRSLAHTRVLRPNMIFKMCTGRNPYQLCYFYILKLTSEYPYLHTSKKCEEGECRYITRSLQCRTQYIASQNRKHFDWWQLRMFIVWGTEACSCALSFLRHFNFIDGICAALFRFIYNAVQIMLKMKTR